MVYCVSSQIDKSIPFFSTFLYTNVLANLFIFLVPFFYILLFFGRKLVNSQLPVYLFPVVFYIFGVKNAQEWLGKTQFGTKKRWLIESMAMAFLANVILTWIEEIIQIYDISSADKNTNRCLPESN